MPSSVWRTDEVYEVTLRDAIRDVDCRSLPRRNGTPRGRAPRPTAHRPHTWHATARLSNGLRLRFTLAIHGDGVACVTRYARLASDDVEANVRTVRATTLSGGTLT